MRINYLFFLERRVKFKFQQITSKGKTINISNYFVAYIDILGQRDKILKIPSLVKEGNLLVIKESMESSLRPIFSFRKNFERFLNKIYSARDSTLTDQEQTLISPISNKELLKFRTMSDGLQISVSLAEDGARSLPAYIFSIFRACSNAFLSALAEKYSIRGGIEIATALELDSGEIYGPAPVFSYALEKDAHWPRILIGDGLLKYLEGYKNTVKNLDDPIVRISKEFSSKILEMVVPWADGLKMVDVMGQQCSPQSKNQKVYTQLIRPALEFVIQEKEKFLKNKNSDLGKRFSVLHDYMQSKLRYWQP